MMIKNSHQGNITRIQLCLPLMARALESEKVESAFHDDLAVQIARKLDPETRQEINVTPELRRMAWISLSIRLDKLISDFLARYPGGTVVNIGCGLDTTYFRLRNKYVLWYDLDLPEIIEFRKKYIPESTRYKYIKTSFFSREWINFIKYDNNILFLATGVLYYYKEESIRKLVMRLVRSFPKFELVFDVISVFGIKALHIMDSSNLKWQLNGIKVLLSWSPRIVCLAKYTFFKGIALRMNWKQKVFVFLFDLLNIQYILHLRVRPDYKHLIKKVPMRRVL